MNEITQENSTEPETNHISRILTRLKQSITDNEVEIHEREDEYQFTVDLTEYSDDDVDVTVENGFLNVSAESVTEVTSRNNQSMSRKSINRRISIPEDVDSETIDYYMNNGVLVVNMGREE